MQSKKRTFLWEKTVVVSIQLHTRASGHRGKTLSISTLWKRRDRRLKPQGPAIIYRSSSIGLPQTSWQNVRIAVYPRYSIRLQSKPTATLLLVLLVHPHAQIYICLHVAKYLMQHTQLHIPLIIDRLIYRCVRTIPPNPIHIMYVSGQQGNFSSTKDERLQLIRVFAIISFCSKIFLI